MGTANAALVEIFSELVNNAAEHGMTPEGAHAHVRFMPHRRGQASDVVIADSGPGIRATLALNPDLPQLETDSGAIGLAIQELVSGTGDPTRGIGLWMTVTEMGKPGRKLLIHAGTGLLTTYGEAEPELRETGHRQGVMVRLTIPASGGDRSIGRPLRYGENSWDLKGKTRGNHDHQPTGDEAPGGASGGMGAPEVALKLTLAGAGMGIFACAMGVAPAAYFALRGGYTGQGYYYISATVAVILLSTVWMHRTGIKHERDLGETD